jgi:hypothetical protein
MQGKNASKQKYYAAEGFDPLLHPEFLWQFHREAANPPRSASLGLMLE